MMGVRRRYDDASGLRRIDAHTLAEEGMTGCVRRPRDYIPVPAHVDRPYGYSGRLQLFARQLLKAPTWKLSVWRWKRWQCCRSCPAINGPGPMWPFYQHLTADAGFDREYSKPQCF